MFKNLESKKLIKNSGYFIIGEVISKFLFIALSISIGRVLGVESLGIYGFVFAFTGIIFSFSSIGNPVFIRDIIMNKRSLSKLWGNFLILKFSASLIVYIILVIMTQILPVSEKIKLLIYLTGPILFFDIFFETAKNIFVAHQNIKPLALIGILGNFLIVSLSIFFILSGKSIIWVIISFIISRLISAIILNWILVKRFSGPNLKMDVTLCVKWIKKGFYFFMSKQFREGMLRTDLIITSLISGLYLTGIYQAPCKIAVNADFIPLFFGIIFYPYYIKVSRISLEKLKASYTHYKMYASVVGIISCLVLFIFSEQIIVLLYGNEFLESIWILKILAISQLFISLNSNSVALLNAIKKEKICFYLSFFVFLLNLILDLVLIKPYGIIGVAIATVICSAILFIAIEYYIKRAVKPFKK